MKPVKDIEQSIRKLNVESSERIHNRILDKLLKKLDQSKGQAAVEQVNVWKMIAKCRITKIAAALLFVSSWVACYVLSEKVTDLKDQLAQRAVAETDDSATINLYLKEHQEITARHTSASSSAQQPAQMRVNQHDIMYYELFDDGPGYMSPGIIVRGSSPQQDIDLPEAPVISNGHALTLSEAKETSNFDLVALSWLDPGFALDKIRRIKGRDALQLLYTNGIDSVSLFEQPLDGQHRLSRRDFREYAVYSNSEQAGGTILAWRDDARSYVLIGNTELSQLMNMARSISAGK